MSRRFSNIRECARLLDSKQGRDAELYWRSHCRSMADHLQSLGCSADEASRQVMAFQQAVQIELMDLNHNRAEQETQQA